MSLRIWNPFVELARLEDNIREAFEPFSLSSDGFFAPLTDLLENKDSFEIHMNVPGIKADELNIDATSDFIEIHAETKSETKVDDNAKDEEKFTPKHIERLSRNYYRKIHFNVPVDPTTGKVSLQDGVLKVTILKKPEAKKISLNIE